MRRQRGIAGGLVVLVMVLAAGGGGCAARGPNQQTIARLQQINPTTRPVVAATPIIDVHAHTFNARYLPLQGIAAVRAEAIDGGLGLLQPIVQREIRRFYGLVPDPTTQSAYAAEADKLIDLSHDPTFQKNRN